MVRVTGAAKSGEPRYLWGKSANSRCASLQGPEGSESTRKRSRSFSAWSNWSATAESVGPTAPMSGKQEAMRSCWDLLNQLSHRNPATPAASLACPTSGSHRYPIMPGVPLSRDAIAHRGGIALLIFQAHPHDGGVARQGYRRLPVPAVQGVCVHFTPATTQPIKDETFGELLYRFSALVRKTKRTSVAVMEL